MGIYVFRISRSEVSSNIISYCRTSGICVYDSNSSKISDNYLFNNSIGAKGVFYWKNAGIILSGNCDGVILSDNFTKDTSVLTTRQRCSVYIDSLCTNIRCSNITSSNTIENAINVSAQTNGQFSITELPMSSKSYFYDGVNLTKALYVENIQVIGKQQTAIVNAVGGTEIATINAILTKMRTHGLIAT